MKPRKVILTIEMLTNVKLKEFNKELLQDLFDNYWTDPLDDETLVVHQVEAVVVKPDK